MSVNFHALKVAEVRRETADAVSVRFDVPAELAAHFRFQPGQHVTLRSTLDGEDVRRNYSLCAAPADNELRVAIKRVARGRFSTWANEHLKPGATVDVMPPHGSFTWTFDPARARRYAAFAGGSGITPILSLLKTALTIEPRSTFVLCYGNRDTASIIFLEEIARLKDRFMDRLEIYHFLEDEEEDIALFNGRLDRGKVEDVLGGLLDASGIDAFFVCGPAPMMEAVEQALTARAVPRERILIERFTTGELSAAQAQAAQALQQRAAGRQMQLKIDGRKRAVAFDAKLGSILDSARAAGLPAPFACKAGVCATCKARVISGTVEMKTNYALSPEDLALGYVLTCQAVPADDNVVLDYDI